MAVSFLIIPQKKWIKRKDIVDIIGNKEQYLKGYKIQPTQKQKRGIADVILQYCEGKTESAFGIHKFDHFRISRIAGCL